jgi:4-amino-4-deoxy-L-arabinose transferase-like glycosyltransferase
LQIAVTGRSGPQDRKHMNTDIPAVTHTVPALSPLPTPHRPTPYFFAAFGVAALVFAAVAPTLSWLEFSSGSENLVVESVLEMRRGGPWLVPTLENQPRTQKPPLPAWITASAARPGTVAALGDRDPVRRAAAYTRLAWEVRWPALLCSCLTLLAVYELGRVIGDAHLGLAAAAVCGTTVLLLRFGRYATTDVQLALWVNVANVGLAWAVLRGRWWAGSLIAGAALGLAFMSKGPVCLVQTVLPVAGFVAWRRWVASGRNCGLRIADSGLEERAANPQSEIRNPKLPLAAALLLFLAIGLPWYVYLFAQSRGVGGLWVREVTRRGATDDRPDPWYTYFIFLPLILPWAVFFVVGLIGATRALIARRGDRIVLALMLTVVPVLVIAIASPDRKDRYLLPMAGPAAVLAAWGLREVWRGWSEGDRGAGFAIWAHWALLAAIALALPLVGAMPRGPLRTGDTRGPWFSWNLAIPVAAALVVLIAAGVVLQRRRGWGLVPATVAVMLVLQALAMHGYARSADGLSGMKRMADAIWAAYPDADAWFHHNRRAPNDLAIYLDRPTPQLKDLSELRATDRPQVVLMIQKEGQPPPKPPAGWRFVTKTERDRDWLHAFVLPRASGESRKD